MVLTRRCSSALFKGSERHTEPSVPRQMDRARRTNSLACSVPWPQPNGFFSLGTHEEPRVPNTSCIRARFSRKDCGGCWGHSRKDGSFSTSAKFVWESVQGVRGRKWETFWASAIISFFFNVLNLILYLYFLIFMNESVGNVLFLFFNINVRFITLFTCCTFLIYFIIQSLASKIEKKYVLA